jgi:hypothetical protein
MINDKIEVIINSNNYNFFKNKFDIKKGDILFVNPIDINKGSHVKIHAICDICGKEKEIEFRTYYKITNGLKDLYYCHKCSRIKVEKTNLEKYGFISPIQNEDVKNKVIATNIKLYGIDRPSKLDKFKEKQQQTNLERYGVKHIQQNKELKDKTITTNIKIYGFTSPTKTKKVKEKIKSTKLERYNNENYNNMEKYKSTCMDKYNVSNTSKIQEIQDKINHTKSLLLMKKYPNILKVDYNSKLLTMKCDNKKDHIFEINIDTFQNRKKLKLQYALYVIIL